MTWIELPVHIVVVELLAGDRRACRSDLLAGNLVTAAVDRVEQRLREIDARAKELHLLAEPHSRNAARNAVIVTPEGTHQIIILVLQR